jgi:hypothetical protein
VAAERRALNARINAERRLETVQARDDQQKARAGSRGGKSKRVASEADFHALKEDRIRAGVMTLSPIRTRRWKPPEETDFYPDQQDCNFEEVGNDDGHEEIEDGSRQLVVNDSECEWSDAEGSGDKDLD